MTIAVWCVFVAFILAYLPRGMAFRGAVAMDGKYDNLDPRHQQARLTGAPARAQATHQNALESFGPFLGGVWAAQTFGADPMLRDGLALAYVILRVFFWIGYIREWSWGRTYIWVASMLCIIALYLAAGLS